MKRYIASLSGYGNIDHGENPYLRICSGRTITGDTIEEMQAAVRDYIDEYNLGAGNYSNTYVADTETQEIIGYISYNGRWWAKGSKYFPNN